MNKKHIVIYHDNCLDGTTSAWLMKKYLERFCIEDDHVFIPCAYKDSLQRECVNNVVEHMKLSTKECEVYIVDFSFNAEMTMEIADSANSLTIMDHHDSFKKEISKINVDSNNIGIIFSSNNCGAMIVCKWIEDTLKRLNMNAEHYLGSSILPLIEYVQDGDLYTKELKGVNQILAFIRANVELNNLHSFDEFYNDVWRKNTVREMYKQGKSIVANNDKIVDEQVNNMKPVIYADIEFMAINTNHLVSDTGNVGAKRYGLPTMMYKIVNNEYVSVSLRSIQELGKINDFAEQQGGGGHEMACGFEVSIQEFFSNLVV